MKKNYLLRVLLLAFICTATLMKLNAQCTFNCGTGTDGAYLASSNTTLAGGTYNFTSFTINSGVTVTVTGSQPLVIYCTGNVVINGILNLSGGNGANGITFSTYGVAGTAVAGGHNGGDGVYSSSVGPLPGIAGIGPGGAGNQGDAWSGGGGAGYSMVGGSSGNSSGGFGGPAYGNAQITTIDGGSGGGGGSGGYSCGGGGGGGGGGYISFTANGTITISSTGSVLSNGGNGGSDGTGNCGGGGGGSGGSILLRTNSSLTNNGSVSAIGGTGGASNVPGNPYYGTGADGSAGRIVVAYTSTSGSGTISPAATILAQLSVTITHTDVLCNGANTGTATSNPSGGTSPYTYAWSPSGGTSQTASGLSAGNYTVTITDNVGCISTATVAITQPPVLASAATSQAVTCFGNCDGSLIGTVFGGTGSLTYTWNPGNINGSVVNNVCAGTYTLTGTDANGCTTTSTTTVTQPSQIVLSVTPTNATCACDGSIMSNVSGGTPGYTFSWAPSGQNTQNVSNLCAGCYTLTVTDANGCIATQTVCITGSTGPAATVAQLNNVTCNGACNGTATIVPSGGTAPYSFMWSPTNGTSSSYNNLCAGTYTVLVTDANGCTTTVTFTITEPTLLQTVVTSNSVTCFGACDATAAATVFGGTPGYTFMWSPGNNNQSVVNGLCAGTYTFTATDANGCIVTATTVVTSPPQLVVTSSHTNATTSTSTDGTATATVSGGTPAYFYSWAPSGGTGATATGLGVGTYTCTVTDANGCSDTTIVVITSPNGIAQLNGSLFSVNLFPNPANDHLQLNVSLAQKGNVTMEIYNLVGEKIDAVNFGNVNAVNYDVNVSSLANGVYFFKISSGENIVTKKITVSH